MSYAPVGTSAAATVDGEVVEVENVEMLMSPHKPWQPATPTWQPTPCRVRVTLAPDVSRGGDRGMAQTHQVEEGHPSHLADA